MAKCCLAVALHVLVEADANPSLGQDHLKRGPTAFQGFASEMVTVHWQCSGCFGCTRRGEQAREREKKIVTGIDRFVMTITSGVDRFVMAITSDVRNKV